MFRFEPTADSENYSRAMSTANINPYDSSQRFVFSNGDAYELSPEALTHGGGLHDTQLKKIDHYQRQDRLERPWQQRARRAVCVLLTFFEKISGLNLYGGLPRQPNNVGLLGEEERSLVRNSRERLRRVRSEPRPLWTRLMNLFLFYMAIKIIYYTVALQYDYSYNNYLYTKINKTISRQANQSADCISQQPAATASSCGPSQKSLLLSMSALLPQDMQTSGSSLESYLEAARTRVEASVVALKAYGAPYYKVGFTLVAANLYMVTITYLPHSVGQLVMNYKYPFDFSLIRALLDWRTEQKTVIEPLICHQVNKFAQSSANFLRLQIESLSRVHVHKCKPNEDSLELKLAHSREDLKLRDRVRQLVARHKSIMGRARQLALCGRLQPVNRNHLWLDRMSLLLCQLTLLVFISGSFLVLVYVLVLPSKMMFDDYVTQTDPLDRLFLLELWLYLTLTVPAVVFYVVLLTMNSVDQVQYVKYLNELIDCAIRDNDLWLEQYARLHEHGQLDRGQDHWSTAEEQALRLFGLQREPRRTSGVDQSSSPIVAEPRPNGSTRTGSVQFVATASQSGPYRSRCSFALDFNAPIWTASDCIDKRTSTNSPIQLESPHTKSALLMESHALNNKQHQLNSNMVTILIHLKIFGAERQAPQALVGLGSLIALILMSLLPLIARLLMAFLESQVKKLFLYCSFMLFIWGDFINVPRCYVYSRCTDMYKKLSSLLAHAIYTTDFVQQSSSAQRLAAPESVYDEHTIWILRKELNFPQHSLAKFATDAHLVVITYDSLLRIHFWLGLLIVSTMYIDQSNQMSSGLLNESLRIF